MPQPNLLGNAKDNIAGTGTGEKT